MTEGKRERITIERIKQLRPGQKIWDDTVTGFLARRQRSAAITYSVFYRTQDGRQRWYKIGRHGSPWTPDTARTEAKRLLGIVADGKDPASDRESKRGATTVSELCDLYIADAVAGRILLTRKKKPKNASTLATDKGRVERHIKPLLGRLAVAAVTSEDIENFLHDVAAGKTAARVKTKKRGLARVTGGKGTATRTSGLLGAILSYAVKKGFRIDNPAHGVTRFADGECNRRLSNDEYRALGKALKKAAASDIWPPAVAAARFITLTGWRRGEVLKLTLPEIDLPRRTAFLGDTKTGKSIRPLSQAARDDLLGQKVKSGSLVFPPTHGRSTMSGFPKFLRKIREMGNLPSDIGPKTLRHSFASIAGDLGYSELTIAALIGHRKHTTTSKYVHPADAVLLDAADDVANHILELMGEEKPKAEAARKKTSISIGGVANVATP